MHYFFTDYNWIERKIYSHATQLKALGITDIVGVSRGGVFTAFLAAQMLDIPAIHLINYDRDARAATLQPHRELSANAVVLLCEDVAGDGRTLADCIAALKERVSAVYTLVVAHFNGSTVTPDFGYHSGDVICIFPWERHTLNPAARRDHKNGVFRPDSEYHKYGADLDGIFLPDIPDALYQTDLPLALQKRAALAKYDASLFPTGFDHRWTIISSRPDIDSEITQSWLKQNDIPCAKLLLRDVSAIDFPAHADHYTKSEKSAEAKRLHILEQGITHFYESDPLQAVLIAAKAPFVKVCWWNNQLRVRQWIATEAATPASRSLSDSAGRGQRTSR